MHGVTNDVRRDKFIFRTVSETTWFLNWLRLRSERFVDLDLALCGGRDALTIDDATCASRDAALARKMGHEVTMFVSAYHIEFGRPYFVSILNSILDQLPPRMLVFNNIQFKIKSYSDKVVLRKAIKDHLRLIRSEEERVGLIENFKRRSGLDTINLPSFLNVLTKKDLRTLLAAGVRIENHGWTHGEVRNLDPDGQRDEVRLGREWLRDKFRVESKSYAVPWRD